MSQIDLYIIFFIYTFIENFTVPQQCCFKNFNAIEKNNDLIQQQQNKLHIYLIHKMNYYNKC